MNKNKTNTENTLFKKINWKLIQRAQTVTKNKII